MMQRVRIPHRGQSPSSVTQLPILTALHARSPTLFPHIIHENSPLVNPSFHIFHAGAWEKLDPFLCRGAKNGGQACEICSK